MKTTIHIITLILFFVQVSCQENKNKTNNKTMTKYEWLDATSAPLGYPVDVYRGGLQSADGEFTSLYSGTTSGIWGVANRGMSDSKKSIPDHLHVIWVSYAEKKFYEIDTAIDNSKITNLFRDGYFTPSEVDDPKPRKEEFKQIIVGFAPGGVVVLWVSGAGRQLEIGRYKGKEIIIPQEEIKSLSSGPQKNMFDAEYQHKVMTEFGIIPKEVVSANQGKPIPFGLWDSYRERYDWSINLELPDHKKNKEVGVYYLNGNKEELFGELLIEKYADRIPNNLKWNYQDLKTPPSRIDFTWIDDNRYYGDVNFDENEILSAFQDLNKENPNAKITLQIRVNVPKTHAAIKLMNGNKEVWLKNSEIMIRKTKYTN